jgi:hypothetical protein
VVLGPWADECATAAGDIDSEAIAGVEGGFQALDTLVSSSGSRACGLGAAAAVAFAWAARRGWGPSWAA